MIVLFLKKNHGTPHEENLRHVGDLGNIVSPDPEGPNYTLVNIQDNEITLDENDISDITGRTFVVHALEDDLGQGGDEESLRTGNAGARLACGIVEPVNY